MNNGARLTADAQETYDFLAGLYEKNQFEFDKLVPWLREHVEPESTRRSQFKSFPPLDG